MFLHTAHTSLTSTSSSTPRLHPGGMAAATPQHQTTTAPQHFPYGANQRNQVLHCQYVPPSTVVRADAT